MLLLFQPGLLDSDAQLSQLLINVDSYYFANEARTAYNFYEDRRKHGKNIAAGGTRAHIC